MPGQPLTPNTAATAPDGLFRRRRVAGWIAAAAGLGVAGALSWRQAQRRDRLPDEFWSESLRGPDGKTLPLASWRGRPLLINFWATWCPPCVKELPEIDDVYSKNSGKNANFLALAVDNPESVLSFLHTHPLRLPVAVDAGRGLAWAKALGSADGALPLTVIFDARGNLRFRKIGRLMPSDYRSWDGLWTA